MKSKKIVFSLFSGLMFFAMSLPVMAVTFQANENILIDKTLFDDAYIMSANAEVAADVNGDLHIMGGQVVIEGNVSEDLIVGGGRVTVNGNVSGDVRVVGGQVTIYGNVGEDVVVAGGQVDIGRNSIVGGSVLAGVGLLTIDGTVDHDVRGGMGGLMLNGTVKGDVVVTVEDTLSISEKASIEGDLQYSALLETTVPTGVVGGAVVFNKFEEQNIIQELTYAFLIQKVFGFIGALLLLGLMIWLAPRFLAKAGLATKENIFRSFGLGVLTMIGAIVGFLILMLTVVGIPFAVMTFAVFLLVLYFGKIFAVAWLGGYFMDYKKQLKKRKIFSVLSLILLAYYIIGAIPFVGWLVNMVLFLIGVGAMTFAKYEYVKMMREKKLI